jgi:hypothetical protein
MLHFGVSQRDLNETSSFVCPRGAGIRALLERAFDALPSDRPDLLMR